MELLKLILWYVITIYYSRNAAAKKRDYNQKECHAVKAMVLYEGMSQYGGTLVVQQTTELQCQKGCMSNARCLAVDFHLWETSCWMHYATNKTSHANSTCCNHYKKEDTCQYPCFLVYKDATPEVFNGTFHNGSDVTINTCKRQCIHDTECHGFVYLISEQQCFILSNEPVFCENTSICNMTDVYTRVTPSHGHSTWIKTSCLGHDKDTVIDVTTTSRPMTQSTDGIRGLGHTPVLIDFGGNVNDLEAEDDEKVSLSVSTPIILLITGAVVVTMIGVISIVVFSYQKRRQRRLDNQVPNPSSPQHWIKHCSPWQMPSSRQNTCKCDHYKTACPPRGSRYNDDVMISLDTFPFGCGRKMELWSAANGALPVGRASAETVGTVIPRPHVYYPIATASDCYGNPKQGNTSRHSLPQHLLGDFFAWPDSTGRSLSVLTEKDGAGSVVDSVQIKRPRKLTRYEIAVTANDEIVYDNEFGCTDKYYKGERE